MKRFCARIAVARRATTSSSLTCKFMRSSSSHCVAPRFPMWRSFSRITVIQQQQAWDPVMQLYMDAQKHAPKNASELENRLMELEEQLNKAKESQTSKRIKLLTELVEKSIELRDYRRAERHCLALCEANELSYDKHSVQSCKSYKILVDLQHTKLYKLKEALRNQKLVIEIETHLLQEMKASSGTSKKALQTLNTQVYALANALDLMGQIYSQLGQPDEALKAYSNAVNQYESCFVMKEVQPPKDKAILTRKELLAQKHQDRQEMEQMLGSKLPDDGDDFSDVADEEMWRVVDEEKTAVPIEYLNALIHKGEMLFQLEKFRDCYKDLFEVKRLQFVMLESATQNSYDALVKVYLTLGNCCMKYYAGLDVAFKHIDSKAQEAEVLFKKAIEFAEQAFGYNDDRVGNLLYSLGVLYSQRQNAELAEKFTVDAIKVFEKRDADAAVFDETEVDIDVQMRDQIEQERVQAHEAGNDMDIAKLSRRWTVLAKCYLTLGTLYFKAKRSTSEAETIKYINTAEKHLTRSLRIHESIADMFFGNLKNSNDTGLSKAIQGHTYDTAYIINNLGMLANSRGDKLEAIAKFEKALEIGKSIIEPSSSKSNYVVASALLHLGNHFLHTMQDIETAEQYLRDSFTAYNNAFDNEYHVDLADVCISLSTIEIKKNELVKAKRNLEQARNILMGYSDCFDPRLDTLHSLLHEASSKLAKQFSSDQTKIDMGEIKLTNSEVEKRMNEIQYEHNMDKENYAKRKMLELKRQEAKSKQSE